MYSTWMVWEPTTQSLQETTHDHPFHLGRDFRKEGFCVKTRTSKEAQNGALLKGSRWKELERWLKPSKHPRWWFQIFFLFTSTWGKNPIWLIFFRWVETTNQHPIFESPKQWPEVDDDDLMELKPVSWQLGSSCGWEETKRIRKKNWVVLSDEQMSKRWQFSLLNDEQMSNWVGVEHQPEKQDNFL